MKKNNKFSDKVTGLPCEIIDVKSEFGTACLIIKLSSGEEVTREIKQVRIEEENLAVETAKGESV